MLTFRVPRTSLSAEFITLGQSSRTAYKDHGFKAPLFISAILLATPVMCSNSASKERRKI